VTGELNARWMGLWQKLGVDSVPEPVFEELVQAYSSTGRFYHNLAHIANCLSIFDQTKSLSVHAEEVELAIWFHDAVYDTRRTDNEHWSTEWAARVIRQAGLGVVIVERVSAAILATRHDIEVTNTDAQLMVDVDLAILGASQEVFWGYEENIRKEYAWVPQNLYARKRMQILRGFLRRPHIYYHQPYRELLEQTARANLRQAVTRLGSGKGAPAS
jgi:predicted metal-dependent HD superfamily phosphohydrolase